MKEKPLSGEQIPMKVRGVAANVVAFPLVYCNLYYSVRQQFWLYLSQFHQSIGLRFFTS